MLMSDHHHHRYHHHRDDDIYIDFQKAFDKVPHQRLLMTLKSHDMGVNIHYNGYKIG